MLDSLALTDAPRVTISTQKDFVSVNRIVTRLRVDESAYVTVVNVSPAGYARVIFPEQPDEPAFLQGGRTYAIPGHLTGYQWASAVPPVGALGSRFVWYGRSRFGQVSAQGPGYIFVIASRTPLDLQALKDQWYFDGVELGGSLTDMEPGAVIPAVAGVALHDGEKNTGALGVSYARYSGYEAASYTTSKLGPGPKPGQCADYITQTSRLLHSRELSGCSAEAVRWARRVLASP